MRQRKKQRSGSRYARPCFFFYHLMCAVLWPFYRLRAPYTIDRKALKGIKGPAVILAPHTSFSDFAYVAFAL
ncbi:MAG: hypothetical protein J6V82_00055 [Clostridia bacterium]|nr:hypothetical protein [Clostridia bacterium]